jgi:hypothetical protein
VELIGPYLVACTLLVVAGSAKVARPDETARALAPLLPGRRPPFRTVRRGVRVGAAAEAALGVAAALAPRPVTAGLVACSYLVFAAVVVTAMARGGPLATCGCLGRPDTPPTAVHAVLDLVLAGSAVAVAVGTATSGTLAGVLAHQPWGGLPLVGVAAVGAWLAALVLGRLSVLEGVRRQVGVRAGDG